MVSGVVGITLCDGIDLFGIFWKLIYFTVACCLCFPVKVNCLCNMTFWKGHAVKINLFIVLSVKQLWALMRLAVQEEFFPSYSICLPVENVIVLIVWPFLFCLLSGHVVNTYSMSIPIKTQAIFPYKQQFMSSDSYCNNKQWIIKLSNSQILLQLFLTHLLTCTASSWLFSIFFYHHSLWCLLLDLQ